MIYGASTSKQIHVPKGERFDCVHMTEAYPVSHPHMRRVLYRFSGLEVTSETENKMMLF